MSPEFFISPAFFVLVAVTVALLTALVCWLLRDGPNAQRGGMIDLVGMKPQGVAWDWPRAPRASIRVLPAENFRGDIDTAFRQVGGV